MSILSKRRSYMIKVFSLIFLPVATLMAILLVLFDQQHLNETKQQILTQTNQRHNLQQSAITERLSQLLSNFYYLSRQTTLFDQVFSKQLVSTQEKTHLLQFIATEAMIDQFQLFDLKGAELYRVEQTKFGSPQIITQSNLQKPPPDSSIQSALTLTQFQYAISPIALQQKHGEVIFPFKPVIHLSMVLYQNQKPIGVLMVHFKGTSLLKGLRDSLSNNGQDFSVLNPKGYYLLHSNLEKEWGADLAARKHYLFAQEHPQSWAQLNGKDHGHFINEEGIYVFHTIDIANIISDAYPIHLSGRYLPKWKVVSYFPTEQVKKVHYHQMYGLYLIYIILLFVLAIFCYIFAWNQQRLKGSEARNIKQRRILQKRIAELHCLYKITHLTEANTLNFNEMMQQLILQIPAAWSHNQHCSARLVLGDDRWESVAHPSIVDAQKEEIYDNQQYLGYLEVSYDMDFGGSSFLDEESALLQSLALQILKVYQVRKAKDQLKQHQEKLEAQVEERTSQLAETNHQLLHEIQKKEALAQTLELEKKRAEEAAKIKATFLSLVAHDLKSPFFSLLAVLHRVLKHEPNLNPKHRHLLEKSIESGQDLLDMVDKLITINKIQTGRMTPEYQGVFLVDLIEKIINRFIDAAEQKGILLTHEIPPQRQINTDPFLCGEVIHNLIANAVKFCSVGDTVTLKESLGQDFILSVEDTGLGIEPKNLSGLFKAHIFTSTLGSLGEKGSGLGLPYCYDIITLLKGTIEVKSEVNKGTRFSVHFPLSQISSTDITP